MFEGWDNFYIIIGPSAAALIGLMFVVETLTADNEPRRLETGAQVYITPIVFHFAVVLVLSAMTAVPGLTVGVVAAIVAGTGIFGVVYAAVTTMRLFDLTRAQIYQPDLSDKCFYGFFPTLAYAALAGSAGMMLVDARIGEYALGAVTMIILLMGIRNAWDLVTAIVKTLAKKRHGVSEQKGPP